MQFPFVSVIMAIRNEAAFIELALKSVLAQDYPAEYLEIIVSDGMSLDGTRAIVQGMAARDSRIRLIDNPGEIVPKGMNAAIRLARGDIVIRVDGHCEIARDYVRECVRILQQGEAEGVGGPIQTVGRTPVAEAIAMALSSSFGVGGSAFRTVNNRKLYVDTVPFPAYTRSTIETAGLYDEEMVRDQDDEYNYRLRKLGFRILLSPTIRSRYYSRSSLLSLWRQYAQYGFWKVRVLQRHPRQMQPRQFIPSLLVLSVLAALAASVFSASGRMLFALMVSAYMGVDLCVSFYLALGRSQAVWIAPIIFPIVHCSYGFGFISGLWRFRNRWFE
jgi:glycosyltransferase involved in cell wall biosynthesis